MQARTTDSF